MNFSIYEEKIVCKMLCELARKEGLATNMINIKLNGKPMEKLTPDFIRKLPDAGVFEGTYFCPPEKEDQEFRKSLGVKYLDWQEDM